MKDGVRARFTTMTVGALAGILLLPTGTGSVRAQSLPAVTTRSSPILKLPMTERTTSKPAETTEEPETPKREYVVVRDVRKLMQRRIVKTFDFDERKLGNVESIPMYWERYLAEGFPHYLEGRFDMQTGHQAPPSFYLELRGGSVAYTYQAQDIPVNRHSDYLVSAWIKPDRLEHARAWFSAFYFDRNGRKLAETERFSQPVGGGDGQEWKEVLIRLPGGYSKARFVGVAVWVVQPARPRSPKRQSHTIYRQDLSGGAWVDDIQVVRLPRGYLATNQPGNVFEARQKVILLAEVSDPDGEDLHATLDVFAADGKRVVSHQVGVNVSDEATPQPIELEELTPGLYVSRLTVWSGKLVLSEYFSRFAQLAPRINPPGWRNEGFGVSLRSHDYRHAEAVSRILDLFEVVHAKFPVVAGKINPESTPEAEDTSLRFLESLWQKRINVVGVLGSSAEEETPTNPIMRGRESWRSFLMALAEKPEVWRPYLAPPLVRYASFVSMWQAGADSDDSLAWNPGLSAGLDVFSQEVKRLLPSSEIVVPWPILHQRPDASHDARFVSLYVPNMVRPESISEHLKEFKKRRPGGVWVVVQPLEANRYERLARLADLTKRLVSAHASYIDSIFVPSPWDIMRDRAETAIEPREELLVFRTIAEVLSKSRPAGELYLDEGVRALMFDRSDNGVLVLWDDEAPRQGRSYWLYLGDRAQQIDIWGRAKALPETQGKRRIRVGRLPTFIRGTKMWHLDLRGSFALDPPQVESSFRLHERDIRFINPRDVPISGIVRLRPPQGWDVRPVRIPFSLSPGEELKAKIRLRFPTNEIAGRKAIEGHFIIDSDQTYRFTAKAPFQMGLDDFETRCFARVEHNNVIIHQTISHRSEKQVDIEGYVMAPGRPRIVRMYRRIEPGQTINKKYVLEDADQLKGRLIRVGFKEIHGPRLINQIVQVQ